MRGARGKRPDVDKHDRDLLLDPAHPRITRQDLLGGSSSHVRAKHAAQLFLLAQARHHAIELANQEHELIRAAQGDLHV